MTTGLKPLACHLVFLVTVLTGCIGRSEKPIPCVKHPNRNEGFSLCVPRGWSFADTSYNVMSRIDVFGLARNRRAEGITPDISYDYMRSGPERRPWMNELAANLPSGGAIVMFSHFHGGPVATCNFVWDSVGESLATVVDTASVNYSQREPFHLKFGKWGDNWQITVLARNVSQEDSLAIGQLLRSIVLESLPVITQGQAAQIAYRALPREIRDVVETPKSAGLIVSTKQGSDAFDVHFQACEACCGCDVSLPPELEWSFRVHRNGTVEPGAW
jgi:hypothetical protein